MRTIPLSPKLYSVEMLVSTDVVHTLDTRPTLTLNYPFCQALFVDFLPRP